MHPFSSLVIALLLMSCSAAPVGVGRSSAFATSAQPSHGDRVLAVRAFYGIPILQRSFAWDGNGETDTAGVKARHLWQTSDDLALGAGLTLQNWFVGGADTGSIEAEAVGRYYFHASTERAMFMELTGGYMQSTDGIPPGGTEWNMTFSFGPGMSMPLRPDLDLEMGVTYHHVSNALGRDNPRNPSQNEAQLWVGIGLRF